MATLSIRVAKEACRPKLVRLTHRPGMNPPCTSCVVIKLGNVTRYLQLVPAVTCRTLVDVATVNSGLG